MKFVILQWLESPVGRIAPENFRIPDTMTLEQAADIIFENRMDGPDMDWEYHTPEDWDTGAVAVRNAFGEDIAYIFEGEMDDIGNYQ